MDFDIASGQFVDKPSTLTLCLSTQKSQILFFYANDKSIILGTCLFDLAKYVNEGKPIDDIIHMKDCEYDKKAFFEIYCSCQLS